MRSGSLRKRIKIERRTRIPNGGGGHDHGWETFQDNLKARIVNTSGREAHVSDALAGIESHEIFVRESSKTRGITNLMRAVDKNSGKIYNIKAAFPDERERAIKIIAQSGGRDD